MRLSVAQYAGERRKVNSIRRKIQRLHAGDGTPEQWIDSAGIDPRIDRCNACGRAIDSDLAFTERAAAAALQFVGDVIRKAGVPEFVARLALCHHIYKCALNVGGKSKALRQSAG